MVVAMTTTIQAIPHRSRSPKSQDGSDLNSSMAARLLEVYGSDPMENNDPMGSPTWLSLPPTTMISDSVSIHSSSSFNNRQLSPAFYLHDLWQRTYFCKQGSDWAAIQSIQGGQRSLTNFSDGLGAPPRSALYTSDSPSMSSHAAAGRRSLQMVVASP